jgi:hypothetical protein
VAGVRQVHAAEGDRDVGAGLKGGGVVFFHISIVPSEVVSDTSPDHFLNWHLECPP